MVDTVTIVLADSLCSESVLLLFVLYIFKEVHPRMLKACLPKTFKRKYLVVTLTGEPDCCLLISHIYIHHYFLSAFFLPMPYSSSFLSSLSKINIPHTVFPFIFLFCLPLRMCRRTSARAALWCSNHTGSLIVYWTTKADHWFSVRYQKSFGWLQLYELRQTIHTLVGCSRYKMVLAMLGWRTIFFHVSGEIIYLDKICIYYTEMAIRMLT